jgi:hypothetical protein
MKLSLRDNQNNNKWLLGRMPRVCFHSPSLSFPKGTLGGPPDTVGFTPHICKGNHDEGCLVGDRHHLKLDLHGVFSAVHPNACSCVFMARRSKLVRLKLLIRVQAVDRIAERVELPKRFPDGGLRVGL